MAETDKHLIDRITDEKEHHISGGIYHYIQIELTYNSNHIEGSRLSHDETRYIFETHTFDAKNVRVDDVVETVNHFRCIDMVLDNYKKPLSEIFIKDLHRTLKTGTFSAQSEEAVVGDYKKYPNYVGDITTSEPENVASDISKLLAHYHSIRNPGFDDILDFHAGFERIHPFYDGNGRVGRLILFKECLYNDIIPFIITDENKMYYYRGLKEWQTGGERGYLRDTCLAMQDNMKSALDYFRIKYEEKQ